MILEECYVLLGMFKVCVVMFSVVFILVDEVIKMVNIEEIIIFVFVMKEGMFSELM